MAIYLLVGNELSIIVEGRWRRSYKENLEEETWFFVVNRCLPILNLNVTYVKWCDLSRFVVLLVEYDLILLFIY